MADQGHKIPVEVEFKTTGAEDAKRAVRDIQASAGQGPDAGPDWVNDEIEKMREKERAAREFNRTLEESDATENLIAQRRAGRNSMVMRGLGAAGIAGTAAFAAKTIGQVLDEVVKLDAVQIGKLDKELGKQVESAQLLALALENPIQAALKLFTGETVGEAFASMNEQIQLNLEAHEAQIDRVIATGIKQTDELRRLAQELRDANAIMDARDAADAAARDRQDAAAIRDGEDPNEVKKRRAADDAQAALDRIDREEAAKAKLVQEQFENSRQASLNMQRVEANPEATRENIEKAKEAEAQQKAAFETAKREFDTDRAIFAENRRGIREGSAGTVEDLTFRQKEAARKAQEEARRKAQEAARKAAEEAARAAAESARQELANTANANARRVASGGNRNPTLQSIGKDLGKADTTQEIEAAKNEILASSGELGERVVSALLAMAEKQRELVERVAVAESQIKQARSGK